jgi:hypothetical protein
LGIEIASCLVCQNAMIKLRSGWPSGKTDAIAPDPLAMSVGPNYSL